MGKTVEAYRMALDGEIARWNGFASALRKDDREAFEEMMDMFRNNAIAAGNTCDPIIFEPMVMSIVLAQQKKSCCAMKSYYVLNPVNCRAFYLF